MKKTHLFLYSIIIIVLITACGTPDSKEKQELEEVSEENSPVFSDDSLEEIEQIKTKEKKEERKEEITLGETIEIGAFAEITLENVTFGKRIDPPTPDGMFGYYEVEEDDEVYLDTVIKVKNLRKSAKSSGEFVSVDVVYDDGYNYSTFSIIEDKGGSDFTYTSITSIEPLKKGTLHYLAELPEEAESDSKVVEIIINIDGKNYYYKVK